jgi:uncharacterized protein HemX
VACGPATPLCVAIILDALGKAAVGTAAVLGTAAVIDEGSRFLAEKLAEGAEEDEEDLEGFEESLRPKTEREKQLERQLKQDARRKTGRELLEDADAIRRKFDDQTTGKMRQRGRRRLLDE